MNPENEFEVQIYSPVFGNVPCAEIFVPHEVAQGFIEKIEMSAEKNKILYLRTDKNTAGVALNMKYFQSYICNGGIIKLFFS